MKLEIENYPSYLSPSALVVAEKQPNTFYLSRLVKDRMQREPQNVAAAVGSAFDYYIKMKLFNDKFPEKAHMLNDLKEGIETHIDEAFTWGKKAYDVYTKLAFKIEEFSGVEKRLSITLCIKGVNVPLTGYLDATAYYSLTPEFIIDIPFDWKMSGYMSKDAMSPHPGYFWSAINGFMLKGSHKDYTKNISIENIYEPWATQLTTYGWLMGIKPLTEFPVRVDMICFGVGKKMTIAKYCGWATKSFQMKLLERYHKVWTSIMDGSFLNRLASQTDEDLVYMKSTQESWW